MTEHHQKINDLYKQSQLSQSISAESELKIYDIYLTTEDKISILKSMIIGLNSDKLSRVTYKYHRIPPLAEKQVLEECIDILEKYYAVKEVEE